MAYNSVANGRAFAGVASPWAKAFAGIAAGAWVHARAKGMFADELALTGRAFLVIPKIGRCQIEAVALYAPKLGGNKLGEILCSERWGNFENLARNWSKYGRAFVHFSINPSKIEPLEIVDHNGAVRIVNELVALDRPHLPTLFDFDEALGCSLVEARAECDRLFPLHGLEPLPKLPSLYDALGVIPSSTILQR